MKKGFTNVVVWVLYVCAAMFLVSLIVNIIQSAGSGTLTFQSIYLYVASNIFYPAVLVGIAEVVRLITKRIYIEQMYEDDFCECGDDCCCGEDEADENDAEAIDFNASPKDENN